MGAEITHEFISSIPDSEEADLIKPQAHWNAKHKIKNLLGYELVKEKDLPAGTTTYTFDDLDGDTDLEYLFEFDLDIVGSGFTGIVVRPNNITTQQGGMSSYAYNGGVGRDASYTWIPLGWYFYAENHRMIGTNKIYAKTGVARVFRVENCVPNNGSGHYGLQNIVLWWNDTTTNITSLVVVCRSGGSFSGNIKLWKKIPIIPI